MIGGAVIAFVIAIELDEVPAGQSAFVRTIMTHEFSCWHALN